MYTIRVGNGPPLRESWQLEQTWQQLKQMAERELKSCCKLFGNAFLHREPGGLRITVGSRPDSLFWWEAHIEPA